MFKNDFEKYAVKHKGISSMNLHRFNSATQNMISDNYISPTIIEERQLNVASMDVYSRLMMDRIIFLGLGIDEYVANIIQAQLLYLDSAETKDISIYISSPGGIVYSGYGIIDVMDYIESDVATCNVGMCASMAAVLLSNGTKGKRTALKHSKTMIHQPLGGIQGQASEIEITAREIQKLKIDLYETLQKNTGQSFEKIEKDCDRDFWMTSVETKEYGIIDEILLKK